MGRINSIHLHIQTGKQSGAGTDGDVYLGLCGREFHIDSTSNDFGTGAAREYILGEGANILKPALNDPRKQLLFTEKVASFPVYVRFQPEGEDDEWQLQRADVRFNGSLHIDWDTANVIANDPKEGIVLGIRSGLVVHLEDHSHT